MNHSVIWWQEIELVSSNRNGSKGQGIKRNHMTYKEDLDNYSQYEESTVKTLERYNVSWNKSVLENELSLNHSMSDCKYPK